MEESKELQKLYGFMQAFIYITVCIEILLFVHFPFSAYSGGYPFSISGDIRSVPS